MPKTGRAAGGVLPSRRAAEGAALDAGNDIQNAYGDGGGHHEDEGHGHAANGQDEKQYAAENLCECIHIAG